MKKIGMIAGLAWPSTMDYYRLICSGANAHFAALGVDEPHPIPPMHIESVNINYTRGLRGRSDDEASWSGFDSFFRETLLHLERAGADFAFIASNTPHTRIDAIRQGVNLDVISILDATAHAVKQQGIGNALVLGTPVIMQSPAYPDALDRLGITASSFSNRDDITRLQQLIDAEIQNGEFDIARSWLVDKSREAMQETGADSVVLACTELPLAFSQYKNDASFHHEGIPFLNTTVVHAEAVLRAALA